MSDDDTQVDAGLDELTSDALGVEPTESATETQSQPETEPTQDAQERTEEPATPKASAPQPAAPQPTAPPTPTTETEPTYDIDGQRYTLSQLKAMRTSALQLPHLQRLYTEAKQRDEQQRALQPQQPKLDPATVRSQIRASFDPSVKQAVKDGFIEEDFTLLYPDLAASMVMNRDALAAVANIVQQQAAKIAAYEGQQYAQQIRSNIENNMVALSGQHTAFAPLQDPATREKFFEYLVQIDAKTDQVNDPNFLVSLWVAYNKDSYLQGIDAQRAAVAQAEAVRTGQRRTAQGAALTTSRPTTQPTGERTPLQEMVDDFLAPRQ